MCLKMYVNIWNKTKIMLKIDKTIRNKPKIMTYIYILLCEIIHKNWTN